MIIAIASGKGGTGKTTVATNLAAALGKGVRLLDCDVEEPNSHLFIKPALRERASVSTPVPVLDESRCTYCGKCGEICQFKAIAVFDKFVLTFPELCHSCGGCIEVCPEGALSEAPRDIGEIEQGKKNGLELVSGRLKVGEALAPPLIKKVRTFSRTDNGVTIIDAPPGTSCPVIASLKGVDFVLLVTEPTPFGLYDLKLAVGAVRILGIPCGLVINRADIGDQKVHAFARHEAIPVLMEIPFERRIAETYAVGELIVEAFPEWKSRFVDLYERIVKCILNPAGEK